MREAAHSIDSSIARSGETLRQSEWRDELFKTGIRGKGGQRIAFSRVELLPGTTWLHADAETREDRPQRVVACFGPEHAPIDKRIVERAIEERPRPWYPSRRSSFSPRSNSILKPPRTSTRPSGPASTCSKYR